MSNKNKKLGLGIAAVAAAGAGLVYAAQKTSQQKVKKIAKAAPPVDYRNTERGKYEKNSKGIYYTNGNYEAFARPKKPEGVDDNCRKWTCSTCNGMFSRKRRADARFPYSYFRGNGCGRWCL